MDKRVTRLKPIFVETVPDLMVEGCLYVSIKYRTVSHLCACGCGKEVNTPLHPTGWSLTYDGEAVGLWPSVGNWSENCQSHYVIEKGEIQWSRRWTREEIEEGRQQRVEEVQRYFRDEKIIEEKVDSGVERSVGLWLRLLAWIGRRG